VMRRVLVTGSRAWTDTSTIRGVLAAVWGGGTALLASAAYPASADEIAETIWTLTPDLHGGLCAGHPYPSPWDSELDGVLESAAQRARRHREAQAICRRCPIMAACLATRTGNPQLGAGVWGGEVFLEKTAGQHDACIGESGAWPGLCGPPRRTGRALRTWREVSRRRPPGPRRGSV
jgi:hypothetical protein